MSPVSKRDIQALIERAEESIQEAELLASKGFSLGAMRCAYYSMFYSARAILETKQIRTSKHSAVISFLHKDFAKTGEFPAKTARLINKAFETRIQSDYGEPEPSSDVLNESVENARQFLAATKDFLAKQQY